MALTAVSPHLCPKCQNSYSEGAAECMQCGIVFAKYRAQPIRSHGISYARSSPSNSWSLIVRQWLVDSDTTADSLTFYGRVLVLLGLVWWGSQFIVAPLETNYVGESVLH